MLWRWAGAVRARERMRFDVVGAGRGFWERIMSKLRSGDLRHSGVKRGSGVPDRGYSACKDQREPGLLKAVKE